MLLKGPSSFGSTSRPPGHLGIDTELVVVSVTGITASPILCSEFQLRSNLCASVWNHTGEHILVYSYICTCEDSVGVRNSVQKRVSIRKYGDSNATEIRCTALI